MITWGLPWPGPTASFLTTWSTFELQIQASSPLFLRRSHPFGRPTCQPFCKVSLLGESVLRCRAHFFTPDRRSLVACTGAVVIVLLVLTRSQNTMMWAQLRHVESNAVLCVSNYHMPCMFRNPKVPARRCALMPGDDDPLVRVRHACTAAQRAPALHRGGRLQHQAGRPSVSNSRFWFALFLFFFSIFFFDFS